MSWSDNTDFDYDEMCDDVDQCRDEGIYFRTIDELAEEVVNRLKSVGFIVLRYDAYSTDSIYLKLDYGMSNTIRISDHRGKSYLKYRYNLLTYIEEQYVEMDKYPRYYYPEDDLLFMIDKIIFDRNCKMIKYGTHNYLRYMEESKRKHRDDKGFWSKARLV